MTDTLSFAARGEREIVVTREKGMALIYGWLEGLLASMPNQ